MLTKCKNMSKNVWNKSYRAHYFGTLCKSYLGNAPCKDDNDAIFQPSLRAVPKKRKSCHFSKIIVEVLATRKKRKRRKINLCDVIGRLRRLSCASACVVCRAFTASLSLSFNLINLMNLYLLRSICCKNL